jgi:hypothetical protein
MRLDDPLRDDDGDGKDREEPPEMGEPRQPPQ